MSWTQTDPRALELADRVFGVIEVLSGTEEYHATDPEDPLGRLHVATTHALRSLSLAAVSATPADRTVLLRTARWNAADGVHLLVPCCAEGLPHAESVLETMAGVVAELDELLGEGPLEAEA